MVATNKKLEWIFVFRTAGVSPALLKCGRDARGPEELESPFPEARLVGRWSTPVAQSSSIIRPMSAAGPACAKPKRLRFGEGRVARSQRAS
jgi:hypothetical protein